MKDGKALGEDAGTLRLEPRWLELKLSFRPTGGDKNSYLKAADLLREDGRYSIRLTIDGKLYGEYPLTVKGGRIEFQGKQVQENTDPMTYYRGLSIGRSLPLVVAEARVGKQMSARPAG